jgi:hypothetical protein
VVLCLSGNIQSRIIVLCITILLVIIIFVILCLVGIFKVGITDRTDT